MSAPADTKANTLGAGGALELGDLGLLEDGGEHQRGRALVSDPVVAETASKGWGEDGERAGVSAAVDTKANTLGR